MKKITHFPFALAAAWLAAALFPGCKETPEACYTPSANLVDVNTVVTFENCTEPVAKSYTWDFADGTTSTEVSPSHTFTAEGAYLVSLTANSTVKDNGSVAKTLITAGQRLLSLARIDALPATNTQGNTWDASDNPDIAVRFSKGGTVAYQSPTRMDAALTFPMAVQMPTTDLVLSPVQWTISVLDIDNGSEEVMATFDIHFGTIVPTSELAYSVTQGGSTLQLNYTLR